MNHNKLISLNLFFGQALNRILQLYQLLTGRIAKHNQEELYTPNPSKCDLDHHAMFHAFAIGRMPGRPNVKRVAIARNPTGIAQFVNLRRACHVMLSCIDLLTYLFDKMAILLPVVI